MLSLTIFVGSSTAQTVFPPILISQRTSTRAIALEAITFTTEPFQVNSSVPWVERDGRTRLLIFALNLQSDAELSLVTCDGEDDSHRHYAMNVESITPVPGQPWMSAVVVRLDDTLTDVGDLLVSLSVSGLRSNRVRIGIGHIGGGLPDDQDAAPTPPLPYEIKGRVMEEGRGVVGVPLTLTGSTSTTSVSSTTFTGVDGSYMFLVPGVGNYTVEPATVQNWYGISPASVQLNNVTGERTADFFATPFSIPNPFYVLEFDGEPKTVEYAQFWREGVNLGHFFWELWAQAGPDSSARYMLSDGYGGAHALLFGFGNFNSSESNRYQLLGNIFDGVKHDNYFGSDEGPAVGEWGHFAVGWDGQNIITYFNGVPVGKAAFSGPRRTPGPGGGGGRLLIGGSDHQNFDGRIAQVRGFEGSNPRDEAPGGVEASFAPQTLFARGTGNLMSYYFKPDTLIADLSTGYDGTFHLGRPRGTTAGVLFPCDGCPPPKFVIDPSAPGFLNDTPPLPVQVPAPAPVPDAALVFDSFSRPNSTYLFGAMGGLGSTEAGVEGPKLWQTSQEPSGLKPFGILNGRGVLLTNRRTLAWVDTHSLTGNLEISVERHVGGFYGSGYDTGLSFRVVDSQNYFFAYTSENGSAANPRILTVGFYENGQRSDLTTGVTMPANWTRLKVRTKNEGDIQVFADDTLVFSTRHTLGSSVGGVGLYNNSAGLGLVNRWDNFSVFQLQ